MFARIDEPCVPTVHHEFRKVEDCYFKIHRYFLRRDSQVFRDLFLCPSGTSEPEGRTKETAVVLPGVTKYEMSCLLKFLYRGYVLSDAIIVQLRVHRFTFT